MFKPSETFSPGGAQVLGETFACERAFMEPLKSHHTGGTSGQERGSLTPSCTPGLVLLLPAGPLPRAHGHRHTQLPSQTALRKYLHSSSGLQKTSKEPPSRRSPDPGWAEGSSAPTSPNPGLSHQVRLGQEAPF